MKRKIAVAALPLFIVHCCALENLSAKALYVPSDSVRTRASADSMAHARQKELAIDEVTVRGNSSHKEMQMHSPLNTISVGKRYVEDHFGGSLMQSLSNLPGVKAMAVGSGESKPSIRGLGFNRVLVAENGIKHEGQQWGDDHGLEVDQYAIDQVEVIKGPAALTYGSDAIGGVINLLSNTVPQKRFSGGANVFARSNNESVGASLHVTGRGKHFWYKANATLIDYADYSVPADSIPYYSYFIKLKDHRLRNTAGREADGSLMLGYEGGKWNTWLRMAAVNTRSGFFANAHGLEVRLSDIGYDRSRRDIDLPYHSTNHLFAAHHAERHWPGGMVASDLGWQYNRQREYTEPVSHGYMSIPPNTLERSFDKNTFSAQINMHQSAGNHVLQAGAKVEYQRNRRGGWGFILPDFEQTQFGLYAADRFFVNNHLVLSAGIRYDHGTVDIRSYHDWYKTPLAKGDSAYIERSANLQKAFNSFTYSVGMDWHLGHFVLKGNLGKSFRMPIAKELGMDGINYNIFRYEKGNTHLKPETSYQLDAGIVYERGGVTASVTPFLNYFPNYIYLSPTAQYQEGLQLYHYTQSRVVRWGLEAALSLRFLRHWQLDAGGEYLYANQLSGDKKGYTLPFSPPWSARVELRYNLPVKDEAKGGFAAVELVMVGDQNRVVPPEEPTPGHCLLNAAVGKSFLLGHQALRLTLRGQNLLGKKYYDHTSYYRLIDVPEPGRNVSLMAAWSF